MEASPAGLVINNSNIIIFDIRIFLAGGGLGFLATIGLKFIDAWIREIFQHRSEKRARRISAATEINAFCTEGMKNGFRHKPRDIEHILFKSTEIDAISLEVGRKLRQFVNSWIQYRTFLKDHPDEIERERLAMSFKNDAQTFGAELLNMVRPWLK